jgi:hypothetical protein
VARVAGIVTVLLGILLLQGSLCDGTSSVPCVGSCDQTETVVADAGHIAIAVVTIDDTRPADEPGGLVSLCVTVLLAVLFAVAMLRRPTLGLSAPPPTRAPVRVAARLRAPSLPQLCALRL